MGRKDEWGLRAGLWGRRERSGVWSVKIYPRLATATAVLVARAATLFAMSSPVSILIFGLSGVFARCLSPVFWAKSVPFFFRPSSRSRRVGKRKRRRKRRYWWGTFSSRTTPMQIILTVFFLVVCRLLARRQIIYSLYFSWSCVGFQQGDRCGGSRRQPRRREVETALTKRSRPVDPSCVLNKMWRPNTFCVVFES